MRSPQTVRVLYYSGNVTVKSGGKSSKAKLGQQLKKNDRITIGSSSSIQLSINGKVLKYTKAMTLKVSSAIKRAGKGENSVVANSARTLAGASGAGRGSRTSVAGATRASGEDDKPLYFDSLKTDALNTGTMRLNSEIESATGLDDAIGMISKAAREMKGEALILLQPRSTAVSSDPIRFRWMKTPDVTTYVISVKNYLGEEIYSAETTDTTHVWETPSIIPEEIYSWRLTNKENALNTFGASFYRLSDEKLTSLEKGIAGIKSELGEDNPALPMVLGTFYADNDCYGEAAEMFTKGVQLRDDHTENV